MIWGLWGMASIGIGILITCVIAKWDKKKEKDGPKSSASHDFMMPDAPLLDRQRIIESQGWSERECDQDSYLQIDILLEDYPCTYEETIVIEKLPLSGMFSFKLFFLSGGLNIEHFPFEAMEITVVARNSEGLVLEAFLMGYGRIPSRVPNFAEGKSAVVCSKFHSQDALMQRYNEIRSSMISDLRQG